MLFLTISNNVRLQSMANILLKGNRRHLLTKGCRGEHHQSEQKCHTEKRVHPWRLQDRREGNIMGSEFCLNLCFLIKTILLWYVEPPNFGYTLRFFDLETVDGVFCLLFLKYITSLSLLIYIHFKYKNCIQPDYG